MKRVIKIVTKMVVISFLLINTFILPVHSENIDFFKEKLEEVGIPEEYSKNISEHIENLDISTEEIQAIVNNSSEVFSRIKEGQKISDFSLSELVGIYSEALRVANDLDIEVRIDSDNKELEIKDKEDDDVLLKCNIEDAKKYYDNYKKSPFTDEEYDNLLNYLDNSITNNNEDLSASEENDTNKNSINNESNKEDSNIEKAEASDTSNTTESNSGSDILSNKADTISKKNRHRVLSIIYLVLLLCVLLSVVSSKLFKEKHEGWR